MSLDAAYIAKQLAEQVELLRLENIELRRTNTRYENAHVILMIERDELMKRIKELQT